MDGAKVYLQAWPWLEVQQKSKDTVVQVFAKISQFNWFEPYTAPRETMLSATAFFISEEGHLLTNYHVVDQATSIQIQIPSLGREQFDVQLLGAHPIMDIALLQLSPPDFERVKETLGGIPFLPLGNSDEVARTQEILALGYPLGQQGLKSTQGIVSGREKIQMISYIQMTAPINPGSSGGPSLNIAGEVVGINFAGVLLAQNVGFVIPINEVKSAIEDLSKVKLLRRPTLGAIFSISSRDMVEYLGNPGEGGFYIAQVLRGSLLEEIGVQEGDMIYEINGYQVDRFGEISVSWSEDRISMFDLLNRYKVGDKINLVMYRKGKQKEVSFDLELREVLPIRFMFPQFEEIDYEVFGGMVIMELKLNHVAVLVEHQLAFHKYFRTEYQRVPRLLITNILHGSQAQRTRALKVGDVMSEINDKKVRTLEDFREAILASKEMRYVTVKTDERLFAVLSLDKILQEEDELATRYSYKHSSLIDKLK